MKRSMFVLALFLGLFLVGLPSTAHAQGRGRVVAPRVQPRGYGVRNYRTVPEYRSAPEYRYRYEDRRFGPRYGVGVYVAPAAPVFYGYEQVWDPYYQQWVSVPVYWYPNYGCYGYVRGGYFFRWGRR